MKIILCLLTYNERSCLEVIYPQIPAPGPEAGYDEIVAMDGNSTDGTLEFFAEHGVRVIRQTRKGRGSAMLQMMYSGEADAYIFFSPDGNEAISDFPQFRHYLEQGAQLVIASRMTKGAVNEEDSEFFRWRKWTNNAFNGLVHLFFGVRGHYVTDTINGFRAITSDAAHQLKLDAEDYTIEFQMTMRALKHRLPIAEFPTIEGHRIAGSTGAPSIPTGICFIKCLFREIFSPETQPPAAVKSLPRQHRAFKKYSLN